MNPYFQLKWLISDNVNTRMGLRMGFRYQIIATFFAGGIYVVSAFSILRAPFHVYLLQYYGETFYGFNDLGQCVDKSKCDGTNIYWEVDKAYRAEIPTIVIVTMTSAVLNFYYW
jgi:hypothetical protein